MGLFKRNKNGNEYHGWKEIESHEIEEIKEQIEQLSGLLKKFTGDLNEFRNALHALAGLEEREGDRVVERLPDFARHLDLTAQQIKEIFDNIVDETKTVKVAHLKRALKAYKERAKGTGKIINFRA